MSLCTILFSRNAPQGCFADCYWEVQVKHRVVRTLDMHKSKQLDSDKFLLCFLTPFLFIFAWKPKAVRKFSKYFQFVLESCLSNYFLFNYINLTIWGCLRSQSSCPSSLKTKLHFPYQKKVIQIYTPILMLFRDLTFLKST